MRCPECGHEFELTSARYFKLVRQKFACPGCSRRLVCEANPVVVSIGAFIATILMLLGIAAANLWLPGLWCLIGVLPTVIFFFPAGLILDRKWGKLRSVGELKAADIANCVECKAEFNVQELIAHNGLYYCATCKPILLQKLAEGLTIGRARHKHVLRTWWFRLIMLFVILSAWFVARYILN